MKIKLRPIELDAKHDASDDGYYVNVAERGIWDIWIPKDWAEPVPEPIKPGTLCVFWHEDPNSPDDCTFRRYKRFDAAEPNGKHHVCSGNWHWRHARPVTPEDLRRWAGEEEENGDY